MKQVLQEVLVGDMVKLVDLCGMEETDGVLEQELSAKAIPPEDPGKEALHALLHNRTGEGGDACRAHHHVGEAHAHGSHCSVCCLGVCFALLFIG